MREEIENKMTVKYYFNLDAVKSERINKKCYYTPASTYVILNYDKHYMSFDDTNTGLYRSIVFSYPNKDVVCFSPPKSIQTSIFMSKYSLAIENIWINEAIEGVSINLFYDRHIRKWMIATKSSIGGKYWFYGKSKQSSKQPTFLDMFIEAFKGDPNQEVNDLVALGYLPKDCCYNFVLQHQSNNIILPVNRNMLYLVSVYRLNIVEVEYIPPRDYELWPEFRNLIGVIHFPKHFDISNYNELHDTELSKGYMITNMETGERATIKNKRYEDLKALLTIKPEIQYHFLCLFRIGSEKIEDYLKFFPKMKKEFYLMRYFLDQFMKGVHEAYLSKYVHKENNPIVEKYESHVHKIHHTLYLPVLNKRTIAKIRYRTVVEYFSRMEPRELMYILNWDARRENL
jgi:hypothetical protein